MCVAQQAPCNIQEMNMHVVGWHAVHTAARCTKLCAASVAIWRAGAVTVIHAETVRAGRIGFGVLCGRWLHSTVLQHVRDIPFRRSTEASTKRH